MERKNSKYPEVLLIAPNTYAERDIPDVKARGGAHAIPSIGILSVATQLEYEGFKVEVLDADKELLTDDETIKTVENLMPTGGYVGWAGWITTIDRTAKMAAKLAGNHKSYRQILGGPHPSAVPKRTIEKYGDIFDYAIVGEAELAIVDLIKNWGDQDKLKNMAGIVFKKNGNIIFKKDSVRGYTRPIKDHDLKENQIDIEWPSHANRVEDINHLPIPKYELLGDLTKYHLSEFTPKIGEFQLPMLTSRGCPNACYFCDQEVSGHKLRILNPDRTIDYMKYLRSLGVVDFYLTDDCYLVDLENVEETAKKILDIPELKGCIWTAITRANLANRAAKKTVILKGKSMNLLDLIHEAGCRQLHIAPETGNEKLRMQAIGKKITNREIEDAVRSIALSGIEVKLLNMVGLPGETAKETLETLQYIQKLGEIGASYAMIAICTPLPNTPLAIRIEEGKLKWTGDLDDWPKMTLWDAAGVFTTDIDGNTVDYTPEKILYAARGKCRLGNLVTKLDFQRGETIEQKIENVKQLINEDLK